MSRKTVPTGRQAKRQSPRKPGRPKGSRNIQADVVSVEPSRCSACGSTRRSKYWARMEQEYAGATSAGQLYTHIIRRRTRCLDCGQQRIDKTYENRPACR